MTITALTSSQISTTIWGAAVRNLTGLGGAQVASHQAQTTVAAASHVDLRSSANVSRSALFGITANATAHVDIWDGTNRITGQALAAGASFVDSYFGADGSVGIDLNNTGAGAANYMYALCDFHV